MINIPLLIKNTKLTFEGFMVKVLNVDYRMTKEEIEAVFLPFGHVIKVNMDTDESGKFKGNFKIIIK